MAASTQAGAMNGVRPYAITYLAWTAPNEKKDPLNFHHNILEVPALASAAGRA